MNLRKVILSLFLILTLTSCNRQEETYEKRDVEVDSVFDDINKSNENNENEEVEEEKSNQNQAPQSKEENISGARATTNVNLRESPTTDEDNFITSIPNGAEVEVLEEINSNGEDWIRISYNGREGFVKSEFIEK